jgi:hypothetical protein
MAVNYSKTSPYSNTETFAFFLDVANLPSIPLDPSERSISLTVSMNIVQIY